MSSVEEELHLGLVVFDGVGDEGVAFMSCRRRASSSNGGGDVGDGGSQVVGDEEERP